MASKQIRAALFDLDGVVFNTEDQYTVSGAVSAVYIIRINQDWNIPSKDKLLCKYLISILLEWRKNSLK